MLQPTPPDSLSALPDDELLRRFVEQQDRAALTEVVSRHGTLVFGICRRVLGHHQDAEDAFQATFAVLAKNASRVRRRGAISCWLHGVAYRISLKMLNHASRLRTECLVETADSEESPLDQIARRSDEEILDEELQGLPEQFRTVLILRYLESCTNQEIAEQLRLSVTAVEARLKRARGQLRQRLMRRGLTLATFAAVITATQTALPGTAAAGELLLQSTVICSLNFSAGHISGHLVSHQLAAMELASMTIPTTKLITIAGALALTVSLAWFGSQNMAQAAGDGPAPLAVSTALPGGLTPPAAALAAQNDPTAPPAARPPAPRQPSALSRSLKQSRERIEAALEEPTEVEFIDTPLRDALEFMGDLHKIKILLDTNALDEVGIQPDTPINLVLSEVAFQSVLNLMLEKMKLDYVLKDEVLMVTTRDEADMMMETRVYWVDGLSVNAEGVAAILTESLEPASWTDRGGPGSLTPISVTPQQPKASPGYNPLGPMGAATEVMSGGLGMGAEMGGLNPRSTAVTGQREGVVISQSQRMHRKIAELLEQLQQPARPGH